MNKDEIKKALERCLSNDCDNCPYYDDDECRDILIDAALTLITKQEKEIEQLKDECEYRKKQYDTQLAENTRLNIEYDKAFERLKAQQREIDALKDENEELTKVVSSKVYDLIDNTKEIADAREAWEKQAKIDVLNELKDKMFEREYMGVKYKERIFYESEINELIKEIEK